MLFWGYIALITCSALVYFINRKYLAHGLAYLGVLLLLTAPKEVFTHTLYQGQWKYVYNHVFQLLEFILLSLVYYSFFTTNSSKRTVKFFLWTYIPVSLILLYLNRTHTQDINYNLLLQAIFLALYSMLYIYELFQKPVVDRLWATPFFWINTGILFYYAGSFFQVGFHRYLLNTSPVLAEQLNLINHILNYFLYLCFMIGFLCKNQK